MLVTSGFFVNLLLLAGWQPRGATELARGGVALDVVGHSLQGGDEWTLAGRDCLGKDEILPQRAIFS